MAEEKGLRVRPGCTGCPAEATVLCTWGLYPHREQNRKVPYCNACLDKLWQGIKGPVAAGLCHYQLEGT